MKKSETMVMKSIHYDYKAKHNIDLEKRLGKRVIIVGERIVGKSLEIHFDDGFVFKTAPLDLNGYINIYKRKQDDPKEQIVDHIVLCTKDLSFVFGFAEKEFKFKLNEQLKLEV